MPGTAAHARSNVVLAAPGLARVADTQTNVACQVPSAFSQRFVVRSLIATSTFATPRSSVDVPVMLAPAAGTVALTPGDSPLKTGATVSGTVSSLMTVKLRKATLVALPEASDARSW